MRLDDMRESDNVEDRRRSGGARMAVGGGLGTILVVVLGLIFGVDPSALLNSGSGGGGGVPGGLGGLDDGGGGTRGVDQTGDLRDDERGKMVSKILASTEDVWRDLLAKSGKRYADPTLVLFRGQVQSACGLSSAAVGPFYCPGDSKVYIDLSFFDELDRRFAAPGDFAQAYVIAHEVGHHVQNLLGISDQVHAKRSRLSKAEYNALSVRLELQADYFAGVWAHHAEKRYRFLEAGDIEEGLRAASAIGDDKIQMQSRGYVVPDSFTHGSSAQRVKWFRKGLETGDLSQGDTFSAANP